MLSLNSLSLSGSLLICTYLTQLSVTDPNADISRASVKPHSGDTSAEPVKDRIRLLAQPRYQLVRRLLFLVANLYPVLLVVTQSFRENSTWPRSSTSLCPHPANLNPTLLQWDAYTTACIVSIIVGGILRVKAFRDLGENFTFVIRRPTTLVSEGLYHYVQHPSYTAQVLVFGGHVLLCWRWDGAFGCFLSQGWKNALEGWGRPTIGVVFVLSVVATIMRVRDEEKVLKASFGKEWERWRKGKKRFVPGIF